MRYESFVKELAEKYAEQGIANPDNFPNIELYLDQMVGCLNKELAIYGSEKNPPVTKATISNYTKHKMLPKPVGKKYTKAHLELMTTVFYLKNCFSMEQIQRLMAPIMENYESAWDEKLDVDAMYRNLREHLKEEQGDFSDELKQQIVSNKKFLSDLGYETDDYSEIFMLILGLVMKSNAERFVAEKLLEEYFEK